MRKHISFTAIAALLALTMIGCAKSAVHATNARGAAHRWTIMVHRCFELIPAHSHARGSVLMGIILIPAR
jgi:hypothetical protein